MDNARDMVVHTEGGRGEGGLGGGEGGEEEIARLCRWHSFSLPTLTQSSNSPTRKISLVMRASACTVARNIPAARDELTRAHPPSLGPSVCVLLPVLLICVQQAGHMREGQAGHIRAGQAGHIQRQDKQDRQDTYRHD